MSKRNSNTMLNVKWNSQKMPKFTKCNCTSMCVCVRVSSQSYCVRVLSFWLGTTTKRETTFLFTFWHRETGPEIWVHWTSVPSLGHKEDFTKKFWEYMSDSACTQAALIVHAHTHIQTNEHKYAIACISYTVANKRLHTTCILCHLRKAVNFLINHDGVCSKMRALLTVKYNNIYIHICILYINIIITIFN